MRAVIRERVNADPHKVAYSWRRAFPAQSHGKSEQEVIGLVLQGLEGVRLGKSTPLGEMLPMAFHDIAPRLFSRVWRSLNIAAQRS